MGPLFLPALRNLILLQDLLKKIGIKDASTTTNISSNGHLSLSRRVLDHGNLFLAQDPPFYKFDATTTGPFKYLQILTFKIVGKLAKENPK